MKLINKITAGVLAASAMLTFTACGEDTAYVATSGDMKIPAGIYIYNQFSAYNTLKSEMTDVQTSVWDVVKDGQDAKSYINAETEKDLKRYIAVENKFNELGLSFTDSENANITTMGENYYNSAKESLSPNGIGVDSYTSIIKNAYKENLIFNKYYNSEDGIEAVSESTLKSELKKNYARIKYIQVDLKDEEGNLLKGSEKQKQIDLAKDYVSRATVSNFSQLMFDYFNYSTELSAKAAGEEYTPLEYDAAQYPENNLESIITKGGTNAISDTAVDEIINHSTVNKAFLIQEDEVCYIVIKLDILGREDIFEDKKATILSNLKSEEFDAMVNEWAEAVQIDWNEKAVERYKPENLKDEPATTSK